MCSAWQKAKLRASARETCEAWVGADAVATHLVGLRAQAPRPVLHETVDPLAGHREPAWTPDLGSAAMARLLWLGRYGSDRSTKVILTARRTCSRCTTTSMVSPTR
jgi:hypothetical protein